MNGAERLARLKAQADAASDKMYDAPVLPTPPCSTATPRRLYGATALANELGQEATAEWPCSIKAVFRSQFT
jgi:hypothetical protein